MSERLTGLTRESVQATMKRIEPQESYSALISSELQETVFGQPQAADAVARRLALFDTGLSDPKRPLGVMMFLGSSGVGKTEMAHAAAKQMFNDTHSDRLKIINMAEMSEAHTAMKFTGSPPSYVGYGEKPLIPHDWLHAGRSIIVLDELEKAHPAVQQLFLGALDKGTMESRNGQAGVEPLNFHNTLFILTSNIGGREMHDVRNGNDGIGFSLGEATEQSMQKRVTGIAERGLKNTLSPEFLNRIDDVVVFHEITDRQVHVKIFDKFVAYRNHDLFEERGKDAPYFAVTEEFRDHILDTVGNKGGREMKRELERELFNKAADVFMGMDIQGRPLVADYDPDTKDTVFYTDDVPLQDREKKDFSQPTNPIIPFTPRTESGDTDTDGTSQQKTEEPPPEEEIEPYQGDGGDEIPDFDPPEPPGLHIGLQIRVWDEDLVAEDGEVEYGYVTWRRLPLPTK